nr:pyruvate formate lyase family protein [Spiroplasma mirum]
MDADKDLPVTITSHAPDYLDKDLEKVVGVQTEKPFKRAMKANGGVRMVQTVMLMKRMDLKFPTE